MASRYRTLVTAEAVGLVLLGATGAAAQSVLPISVESDAGGRRGACVLVHRADRERGVSLYFLTAAGLFLRPDGTHARLRSVTIRGPHDPIEVAPEDVALPSGHAVDVAVVRAEAKTSPLASQPISFAPPAAGGAFAIVGPPGAVERVLEHVRFASTLLLVGDRDASELDVCVGAPAIDAEGVFGIVSDCRAQRVPLVSLLPMARPFLLEHIPGLAAPRETMHRP